jgi:hypothetical protein
MKLRTQWGHFAIYKGTLLTRTPVINRISLGSSSFRSLRHFSVSLHLSDARKPITIKWFYATDSPLSKPEWFNYTKDSDPGKFLPFSEYDSNKLEVAYQKYGKVKSQDQKKEEQDLEKLDSLDQLVSLRLVEVNEDKLFQVDVSKLQLEPVYWEGPIYEVRRGKWFGSDGIPISNEDADLIEAGYQAKKPYNFGESAPSSKQSKKLNKESIAQFNKKLKQLSEKVDLVQVNDIIDLKNGKLVLYFNEKNAVMFPDSVNSSFEIGVIRNFGPSRVSLISVEHIQRGFTGDLDKTIFDNLPQNPIPRLSDVLLKEVTQMFSPMSALESEKVIEDSTKEDSQMKSVLESDYDFNTSSKSDREVDHLVLCIHGIGQILGNKYESINFTHSINVLRNTMKSVYKENEKFKKLAYPESEPDSKNADNNRIQVLPISWRHKIDFHPERAVDSLNKNDEQRLPSLSQLNVDGVKSLRNLLGDVVLDVLLYYEPRYINSIFEVVTSELNRVYELYMERNPNFNGKVHIMGHSLGSVISFDILAKQTETKKGKINVKNDLTFPVHNLFCVGSPVGVFKLLSQTNIAARYFTDTDFDPTTSPSSVASPKCRNLYNIFHPCDPVGYRMEPLVNPRFSIFKPEAVPFAVRGINSQIEDLASFGDGISEKFSKASSWFSGQKKYDSPPQTVEEQAERENALGDILSSLAFSKKEDTQSKKKSKTKEIKGDELTQLTKLNKTGRIDYALPMGVFDISLVAAVSAHVSYFEDENTAGFIMKEILSSEKEVTKKTVSLYTD